MNKYIKTGIISVLICICAVLGWYIGRSIIKNDDFSNVPVSLSEEVETDNIDDLITSEEKDMSKVTYSIISQIDSIYLYEISYTGERVELASKNIEIDLLPGDDRDMLLCGITTEDYSEALKIWEGYVS